MPQKLKLSVNAKKWQARAPGGLPAPGDLPSPFSAPFEADFGGRTAHKWITLEDAVKTIQHGRKCSADKALEKLRAELPFMLLRWDDSSEPGDHPPMAQDFWRDVKIRLEQGGLVLVDEKRSRLFETSMSLRNPPVRLLWRRLLIYRRSFMAFRATRPRSERTKRALARRILRELYGDAGPKGLGDKKILAELNARLGKPGVSMSTMDRARREEYKWWKD